MNGDENINLQINETTIAIQECTETMTTAEQWIFSHQFEPAIPLLKRCREYAPLWRMPFTLLLRCYVKLGEVEQAWELVQSIDWVNQLGRGEEVQGPLCTGLYEEGVIRRELDETFVSMMMMINDNQ